MKVTKFIVTASAVLMCTSTVFAQTPSTNTLSFYDSFITRVQAESKKTLLFLRILTKPM